jgi:hypothetical protein
LRYRVDMKKRIPQKLVLRHETLRALKSADLAIAGGGGGYETVEANCSARPAVAPGAAPNPGG